MKFSIHRSSCAADLFPVTAAAKPPKPECQEVIFIALRSQNVFANNLCQVLVKIKQPRVNYAALLLTIQRPAFISSSSENVSQGSGLNHQVGQNLLGKTNDMHNASTKFLHNIYPGDL